MAEHGSHYCDTCHQMYTAHDSVTDALTTVTHAREDMRRYERWMVIWSGLDAVLGTVLVAMTLLDQLTLTILFGIMFVASDICTISWWNIHDGRKTRSKLRAAEREWQRVSDIQVAGGTLSISPEAFALAAGAEVSKIVEVNEIIHLGKGNRATPAKRAPAAEES
jgi:hypothetical protein